MNIDFRMRLLYPKAMSESILIDATHFATSRPTGVERYVDHLLPLLSSQLVEKGYQVGWIGHATTAPDGLPAGVDWVRSPVSRLWSQVALPRLLRQLRPVLYFTPSGIAPLSYNGKTALTVHDLAAYREPASFSPGELVRQRLMMSRAARRAASILVPSQFTAQSVIKTWKVPASRIHVTPLALAYEAGGLEPEPVAGIDPQLPFFLYVGRLERKKNLLPLIAGFAALAAERPCRLVLAGKDSFRAEDVRAAIAALPAPQRAAIILPGYVSDAQLEWLYSQALATVVPSHLEGFGMPVLESFAHALPTLCADAGSLPEVADKAAQYVQFDSASDWRQKLEQILDDASLRQALAAAGQQRLKEYSWQRTAQLSAEALGAVLA